jgi:hypothetical protein
MDDTKPPWKVGKAIVEFAGVSVAQNGSDKALDFGHSSYRKFSGVRGWRAMWSGLGC